MDINNNVKEETFEVLTDKDLWGLKLLKFKYRKFTNLSESFIGKDGRIYLNLGNVERYIDYKDIIISYFGKTLTPLLKSLIELFIVVDSNTCQGVLVKYALRIDGTFYEEETDKSTKRALVHLLHSKQQELYKNLKDTYNKFIDFALEWRMTKLRTVVKDKYYLKGEFVFDEICGDTYTQVYKKDSTKPINNDNIIVISMQPYYKNI